MPAAPAHPIRRRGRLAGWLYAVAPAFLLAGCATVSVPAPPPATRTGVGQRMITPANTARYELASHQAFVFPQILANDAPEFPAGYRPPSPFELTVCASLVVADGGAVRDVRLVDAPGCEAPAAVPAPLRAAVTGAMSHWRFRPALLCEYPDADTRNRAWNGDGCAGPVREARPVPVTLSWAFIFELRDGQARVEGRRTGAQ